MPAVSKKQQRFMGMVHAAQMGEGAASPEVAAAANSMSKKSAKDFASTPQKGLPEAAPKKKTGPKWGTTGKISGDIVKKNF
jgi:hypothetical protein